MGQQGSDRKIAAEVCYIVTLTIQIRSIEKKFTPCSPCRLSNQTLALDMKLTREEALSKRLEKYFDRHVNPVRYSEYEIIQHQKEELEMQNKRMIERISKLQFVYKGKLGIIHK